MDIFVMKDGRKVTVDFKDIKSIFSVSKKDMKEISSQIKEWTAIACSKLTGEEVYNLLAGSAAKGISFKEYLSR